MEFKGKVGKECRSVRDLGDFRGDTAAEKHDYGGGKDVWENEDDANNAATKACHSLFSTQCMIRDPEAHSELDYLFFHFQSNVKKKWFIFPPDEGEYKFHSLK